MIKTFRGQLADQEVLTIRLSTNNGMIGYKIRKFQLFPAGATSNFDYESFVSIFKTPPGDAPADATPTFDNGSLVACAYYSQNANATTYPEDLNVVFDNMVFNQDIYASHSNSGGGEAINYYLELEQIALDLNEATVATLKDMRGTQ